MTRPTRRPVSVAAGKVEDMDDDGCECFWTPPEMWLSAASCGYGGGYEPGSQMEWNPDCPVHRPTATQDPTP